MYQRAEEATEQRMQNSQRNWTVISGQTKARMSLALPVKKSSQVSFLKTKTLDHAHTGRWRIVRVDRGPTWPHGITTVVSKTKQCWHDWAVHQVLFLINFCICFTHLATTFALQQSHLALLSSFINQFLTVNIKYIHMSPLHVTDSFVQWENIVLYVQISTREPIRGFARPRSRPEWMGDLASQNVTVLEANSGRQRSFVHDAQNAELILSVVCAHSCAVRRARRLDAFRHAYWCGEVKWGEVTVGGSSWEGCGSLCGCGRGSRRMKQTRSCPGPPSGTAGTRAPTCPAAAPRSAATKQRAARRHGWLYSCRADGMPEVGFQGAMFWTDLHVSMSLVAQFLYHSAHPPWQRCVQFLQARLQTNQREVRSNTWGQQRL